MPIPAFEKVVLTDRAYFVLGLARRAAESRHERVLTTEHILHGLVMEGSGIAANILYDHDVTLGLSRDQHRDEDEFTRLLNKGRIEFSALSGEAKNLMDRARAEAIRCRQKWPKPDPPFAWIGTEHLLMALTEDSSSGGRLLESEMAQRGTTAEELHEEILTTIFG